MGNLLAFPDDQQPALDPAFGQTAAAVRTSGRPAIESMVTHVKEVLPQVPVEVIRKDLIVTTNVDETITRLLDGTVTYQPEKKPSPPVTTAASTSSSNSRTSLSSNFCGPSYPPLITAASTFGKSADERHRSFEERKNRLIEESRRRYLAKHPVAASSSSQSPDS